MTDQRTTFADAVRAAMVPGWSLDSVELAVGSRIEPAAALRQYIRTRPKREEDPWSRSRIALQDDSQRLAWGRRSIVSATISKIRRRATSPHRARGAVVSDPIPMVSDPIPRPAVERGRVRSSTTVSPAEQMGTRVRELRKAQDMTQAELARRAQLTRVYITRLEAGRPDPSLSTINALARALGVSVSELLE